MAIGCFKSDITKKLQMELFLYAAMTLKSKLTSESTKVKVFFIIMHFFNGLQQKEITIYKKSNIKTL